VRAPRTYKEHYRVQLAQTHILPASATDELMDEHLLTPSPNMRGKTLVFGIAVRRVAEYAVVVLTELLNHEGKSITNFYDELATRAYGCHPMLSDVEPRNVAWCERYLDQAHWRKYGPDDRYPGVDLVRMDWDSYEGFIRPVWGPLRPNCTDLNAACRELHASLRLLPASP
jgi:hypothetical protein